MRRPPSVAGFNSLSFWARSASLDQAFFRPPIMIAFGCGRIWPGRSMQIPHWILLRNRSCMEMRTPGKFAGRVGLASFRTPP